MGRMYGIAVLYGLVLVGMAGWCWCTWRAGVGVHGGLPLPHRGLDWSGQKWAETADCLIFENPHKLQNPNILGALFSLPRSFLACFWSIPGVP
jgi:hypothetical protein